MYFYRLMFYTKLKYCRELCFYNLMMKTSQNINNSHIWCTSTAIGNICSILINIRLAIIWYQFWNLRIIWVSQLYDWNPVLWGKSWLTNFENRFAKLCKLLEKVRYRYWTDTWCLVGQHRGRSVLAEKSPIGPQNVSIQSI